jgi:heme A synthase
MNPPSSETGSGHEPDTAGRRTFPVGVLRLLLFEASTFVAAAAVHFGTLLEGYGHRQAGTAETVTAVVLLAALALTWAPSPWPRRAAVGAQAFAILGVLVGLFTIAVGVGPRTAPDVAYHLGILAVLVVGLAVALWGGTPSLGARHG